MKAESKLCASCETTFTFTFLGAGDHRMRNLSLGRSQAKARLNRKRDDTLRGEDHVLWLDVQSKMSKQRVDKVLVERGFVESRTRAQALILAGHVLVREQRIDK